MLSMAEILGRLVVMVLPLGVADQSVIIFLQVMKVELLSQLINIHDLIFTLENHFLKSLFSKSKDKTFVRSGIRTHASNWRPEHSYADAAQGNLESGALDRSAILT